MVKIRMRPPFMQQAIMQCFKQAWHSLQHKYLLFLGVLPFCCAIVLWLVVLTVSIAHFDWFMHQFPSIWINYALNDGILSKISYYLLIFFATIAMLFCGVIVVGICMGIINAFLAPLVVQFVHKTYYQHVNINPPDFMESLRLSGLLFLSTLLKFVFFSLCCYLLSFVGLGFIGLVLGIFVYFWFYCKNLNHDVGISIMSKDLYKRFEYENKIPLLFIDAIIFIPLYVPILNCFIAIWQLLVLSHYAFAWYSQYSSDDVQAYIEDAVIIE